MVKHKMYVNWRHLATKFFFLFFNYFEGGEPISDIEKFQKCTISSTKTGVIDANVE